MNQEPDWEQHAREQEMWVELNQLAVQVLQRNQNAKPLVIRKLKAGTRLLVRTFLSMNEDEHYQAEIRIIDPDSLKIEIGDKIDFVEPKEGTLLTDELRLSGELAFEVGGKRYQQDNIQNIWIGVSSGEPYEVWPW